jgi:ribosomal-protein-alanine N-acetyltransferase
MTLLPLDSEMIAARLVSDDFRLDRMVDGETIALHFGPEFPGDALALYPRYLTVAEGSGRVDGTFVVIDHENAEVVGQLGTMGPPTADIVEIGYGVNASAQGRGIATAAVAALVRTLEGRPGLDEIVATTAASNRASRRVLEKNGFVCTGREQSAEGELLTWAYRPHRRRQ